MTITRVFGPDRTVPSPRLTAFYNSFPDFSPEAREARLDNPEPEQQGDDE
jgi:hypothetical protein